MPGHPYCSSLSLGLKNASSGEVTEGHIWIYGRLSSNKPYPQKKKKKWFIKKPRKGRCHDSRTRPNNEQGLEYVENFTYFRTSQTPDMQEKMDTQKEEKMAKEDVERYSEEEDLISHFT